MANKLYEENDIQRAVNAIRRKTGKAKKFKVSQMESEIDGIISKSEPILQDKTITENGVYSPDSGFDGFGKVTVDVLAIDASEGIYYRNLKFTQAFEGAMVCEQTFSCVCSVTV